jgi:hypothetical protein
VKNLLTGAARPVTDTNERVRKLFENRPFNAPSQPERQNRSRKTFTKAAVEEDEVQDDAVRDVDTPEEEVPELDASEDNEVGPAGAEDEEE